MIPLAIPSCRIVARNLRRSTADYDPGRLAAAHRALPNPERTAHGTRHDDLTVSLAPQMVLSPSRPAPITIAAAVKSP